MSSDFQLRDVFNEKLVNFIAVEISLSYPEFDKEGFLEKIFGKLNSLSFLDRSNLITDTVVQFLPSEFEKSANILLNSLGPELVEANLSGYDGFYIMPLSNYVVLQGMDHFELSMELLYEMTKRFTSEGPMRPFIRKYPTETLKYLQNWSSDPNPHVRRLVSECTRPRLPLASPLREFQKDPSPVIELLERIKNSRELLVRRSIANNLNDISKDNPEIVISTLNRWVVGATPEIDWLIKHALRTLLKQGNKGALKLLGYTPDLSIQVSDLLISPRTVKIGYSMEFEFKITSAASKPQNLMIDYIIHFMKANGKLKPKVFKLSTKTLQAKEILTIVKKQNFKNLSTRKQYTGHHVLEIQINGVQYQYSTFTVTS